MNLNMRFPLSKSCQTTPKLLRHVFYIMYHKNYYQAYWKVHFLIFQPTLLYMCSVHITQTVRTAQSGIEQIYWHECRHFSWLLSGDDWQGSIGTRVGIVVSRFQAVNSLKETNNGRMSWAMPHLGLQSNQIKSNLIKLKKIKLYKIKLNQIKFN